MLQTCRKHPCVFLQASIGLPPYDAPVIIAEKRTSFFSFLLQAAADFKGNMEELALSEPKSVKSRHDLGCYACTLSSETPFAPKRCLASAVVGPAHDVEGYSTALYDLSSKAHISLHVP